MTNDQQPRDEQDPAEDVTQDLGQEPSPDVSPDVTEGPDASPAEHQDPTLVLPTTGPPVDAPDVADTTPLGTPYADAIPAPSTPAPTQPAPASWTTPGPASYTAPPIPAVPFTTAPPTPAAPIEPRGPRVGTVVWGFIIAAVGAGLLALALGATYDVDVAVIVLLGIAGLSLVVGSVVTSLRKGRAGRSGF